MTEERRSQWHLNKEVPISIILALVLQTVSGIWFISKLDSRVGTLEEAKKTTEASQHERDEKQDQAARDSNRAVLEAVRELNQKFDRFTERFTATPKR